MDNHNPLISLRNVSLSYPIKAGFLRWKEYNPLKDISFDLNHGETIGVIGRNGAGKSSLLKLIAGILEPDSGEVINYGARISLLSLGVGFVPHLSGRENAMLSGMILGLRKNEIAQKMNGLIEFSGLGEFIDQPLHTYSAGMRSRLGFSVAIQVDPDILLIDEVLGVGDEDFRKKSTSEMKRLIKSDKSVVLVSHHIPTVQELCDRVVWIEGGCVRMAGEVNSVLSAYQGNNIK